MYIMTELQVILLTCPRSQASCLGRWHSVLFLGDPRQKLVQLLWKTLRKKSLEIQVVCYLKPSGKILEKFEVPELVEILGQKVPNF